MKILLCHPQTQHSHKVAKILLERGLLNKFANPFAISTKVSKYLPVILRQKIRGHIIELPSKYLSTNFGLEFSRIWNQKMLGRNELSDYFSFWEKFQNSISDRVIKTSDLMIGFDSSSWLLQERAKKANLPFILDRTIAHSNVATPLYLKAKNMYPDWANKHFTVADPEYVTIENRELFSADMVTVGSSFVKSSLLEIGLDEHKIVVNPYGVDTSELFPQPKDCFGPLTFLFFGTISGRKGVPTLLAAWKKAKTKDARLILAGYGTIPPGVKLPPNVHLIGKVDPAKRNELFGIAHVFVFPSLLEGFAQALIEAAVCGLPIIATSNSGGAEFIEDNLNGFIVKPLDEDSLADKIEFFIKNPSQIEIMGLAKVAAVREKFSLKQYSERWGSTINNLTGKI